MLLSFYDSFYKSSRYKIEDYTLCNELKIPNTEKENKQDIKIRFLTDIPYFGPGAAKLLELIDEKQSVSIATKTMKMSYSKGWKILHKIKFATGYDVVVTQKGGNTGGTTSLTKEGLQLLHSFRAYEKDVITYANERINYYMDLNPKEETNE